MSDEDRSVALIDMDGTVCNFHGTIDRDMKALFGPDLEKISERTRRNAEMAVRRREGWYLELDPLPLGFEIVDLLKEIGFKLMVLTKGNQRALNAWTEKVQWCKKYLPGAQITITEDKSLVYGKVLVDDFPAYVEKWIKYRPRGLVLMPDHRWNKDFNHPQVVRIASSEDLEAVRPKLEEIYRRPIISKP